MNVLVRVVLVVGLAALLAACVTPTPYQPAQPRGFGEAPSMSRTQRRTAVAVPERSCRKLSAARSADTIDAATALDWGLADELAPAATR